MQLLQQDQVTRLGHSSIVEVCFFVSNKGIIILNYFSYFQMLLNSSESKHSHALKLARTAARAGDMSWHFLFTSYAAFNLGSTFRYKATKSAFRTTLITAEVSRSAAGIQIRLLQRLRSFSLSQRIAWSHLRANFNSRTRPQSDPLGFLHSAQTSDPL